MKTLASVLLALACLPALLAQSADTLVLQGRAFLASKDLAGANARFEAAVQKSPANQTANAFFGLTRLLVMAQHPATQEMLDRLGFSLTNRNIYAWTARVRTDTNGVPIPPNDFDAMEGVAFVRSTLLPAVVSAVANLDRITDRNFILSLASNETTVADVTVDYGDLVLLRSMLHAAEATIYWINSYHLSAQLNALYALHIRGELTLSRLLEDYPQLATYFTTADLEPAKQAIRTGAADYLLASEFIRQRPTNIVRLFNYERSKAQSETEFRTRLVEARDSLDRPVILSGVTNGTNRITVRLGNLLSPAMVPRGLAPEFLDTMPVGSRRKAPRFVGEGFVLGSLPDVTFGGFVEGLSLSDLQRALASELVAYPSLQMLRAPAGHATLGINVLPHRGYTIYGSADLSEWTEFAEFRAADSRVSFDLTTAEIGPLRFFEAKTGSSRPELVWIPAGTFLMGSPAGEEGRLPDEGPQTLVTISRGFWMGKYEVTKSEYVALMGEWYPWFRGTLDHPAEPVSWSDATKYCAALTVRERSAGRLPAGYEYRLPTEAQWEYACRAGSTTPYAFGSRVTSAQANFGGWPHGAAKVGSYSPNAWGLFDMHGNVWEWCADFYTQSLPGGSVTDPFSAGDSNTPHLARGGSYHDSAFACRSAYRRGMLWANGLRVALVPVP